MTLRERIQEEQTVSIDPAMLPIHRENLIKLHGAGYRVWIQSLSRECNEFPWLDNIADTTDAELEDWRNRYNAWFADLSKEDARALARGLVMSGAV